MTMLERGGGPRLLHSCLFAWGSGRSLKERRNDPAHLGCPYQLSEVGAILGEMKIRTQSLKGVLENAMGMADRKREPFHPGITDSELHQEQLGCATMHVPIWGHLLPEHT